MAGQEGKRGLSHSTRVQSSVLCRTDLPNRAHPNFAPLASLVLGQHATISGSSLVRPSVVANLLTVVQLRHA